MAPTDKASEQVIGDITKTSPLDADAAVQAVTRAVTDGPWPTLGALLGVGRVAEVFACGELVVKLYKPAVPKRSPFGEAAILAAVETLGLPAPVVYGVHRIGDRWGVLMSRVDGPTLADAMKHHAGTLPAQLTRMARLQLQVHSRRATQFANLKMRVATNIHQASMLSEPRRRTLLAGLTAMPEGDRLCHGDFHPYNIMGPLGHEVLIDWPNASQGDPAADVCRTYVLLRSVSSQLASAYVDAYSQVSGESRDAILNWLPFVAAARLSEGVPEVDDLMNMLDR
jgi:aminoglycoside phosphotransferase (APT) family kinase protein